MIIKYNLLLRRNIYHILYSKKNNYPLNNNNKSITKNNYNNYYYKYLKHIYPKLCYICKEKIAIYDNIGTGIPTHCNNCNRF